MEFGSKALILSRRLDHYIVGRLRKGIGKSLKIYKRKLTSLPRKEPRGRRGEGWEEEKKRLGTWKVRCLDSETKLNRRITDLEADYDELKEKYEGVEVELEDLKSCIIQEHINGFQKGVRHATFFCEEIDAADPRFDVNKDVVDGQLIDEAESSLGEEAEKVVADKGMNAEATAECEDDKAT